MFIYGRDYFDKLRSIGFKVIEEDYTNKIAPEMVEKYCLAKGRSLFVLNKTNHTRSFFGIIMVLFNSLYLHISTIIMFYSFEKNNTLIVIASATAEKMKFHRHLISRPFPLFRTIKMLFQYSP
jgi:hypothetical protein